MAFITSEDDILFDELDEKTKIRRRSLRDVVIVCPICFSPSRNKSSIFFRSYACSNQECGWEGQIPIEISKEDYESFKKTKQKDMNNSSSVSQQSNEQEVAEVLFCSSCGTKLKESVNFCKKCGQKLD